MVRETRNDHAGKARHAGKTSTNLGEYVSCRRISTVTETVKELFQDPFRILLT